MVCRLCVRSLGHVIAYEVLHRYCGSNNVIVTEQCLVAKTEEWNESSRTTACRHDLPKELPPKQEQNNIST